jgi:hypothetical protein
MNNVGMVRVSALLLVSSFATVAMAEAPPTGVAIGLERAFGLEMYSQTSEFMDQEVSFSQTTFGLGLGAPSASPFSRTRVGVDYIMDSGLSLGGGIGFVTTSSETEFDGDATDGPSGTGFLIAPRVGYMLMFTPSVGLWPRGGITYVSVGSEDTDDDGLGGQTTTETSQSDVALTIEAPLVVMPAPNVGFLIAPTLDYGLSHTSEVNGEESDVDVSVMSLGIQFGLVAVL